MSKSGGEEGGTGEGGRNWEGREGRGREGGRHANVTGFPLQVQSCSLSRAGYGRLCPTL